MHYKTTIGLMIIQIGVPATEFDAFHVRENVKTVQFSGFVDWLDGSQNTMEEIML